MEIFLMPGYSRARTLASLGVPAALNQRAARGRQLGLVLFQSLRDGHKRPDEHAGVPSILAAVQILQRLVQIRFLDKLLRLEKGRLVRLDALRRRQRVADPDVAVTRRRLGWLDADGDNHLSAPGQIKRIRQHLLEFFLLGDDMIGRQHRHDRSWSNAGPRPPRRGPPRRKCRARPVRR